jgi:hypothetical protein
MSWMALGSDRISSLYVLAGLSNFFLLLVFNRCYAGADALAAMIPTAFSTESQMLIQLWGLMYISTAKHYKTMPYLSLIFFVEKMLYAYWGCLFLRNETKRNQAIEMVRTQSDLLAGLFLLTFCLHDFLFALVFAYGAWEGCNNPKVSKNKTGKEN